MVDSAWEVGEFWAEGCVYVPFRSARLRVYQIGRLLDWSAPIPQGAAQSMTQRPWPKALGPWLWVKGLGPKVFGRRPWAKASDFTYGFTVVLLVLVGQ